MKEREKEREGERGGRERERETDQLKTNELYGRITEIMSGGPAGQPHTMFHDSQNKK